MGQAASAELRTAQATISTLTKDLAAARSTLAATEATVQQAKSEAVVRGAQSVGSQLVDGVIARQALERELEEAKRSALTFDCEAADAEDEEFSTAAWNADGFMAEMTAELSMQTGARMFNAKAYGLAKAHLKMA